MDRVWGNLPLELSEHICNQLPKVRKICPELKMELLQRVRVIKEVEYPVAIGLRRAYNTKQLPVEDMRCVVEYDGTVQNMCARVAPTVDVDWWLWFPLETSYMTMSRIDSPIRVRF